MAEAAMFAQGAKRQEKALWPLVVIFSLIGLAAGTALPLSIEPQIIDAGATIKGVLVKTLVIFGVVMGAFLAACATLKRPLSGPAALLVGAAAVLGPMAGPFVVDGVSAVLYNKERAVLAELDSATKARIAEHEAKLVAADLGALVTREGIQGRDFTAYRARIKSFRDASEALKMIATQREVELRTRLATSGVSPDRQARMLQTVRDDLAKDAPLTDELYAVRIETADLAASAVGLMAERHRYWDIWNGQFAFSDPQMAADFGRQSGKVRSNMGRLRRLEGKRQVIGATAQKKAD